MMYKSYKLENKKGLKVIFSNLGGRIFSTLLPQNNDLIDIIAGPRKMADYIHKDPYMGAICGRFANRISNGKFKIDNKHYQLSINDGQNHLHGGYESFSAKLWQVEEISLEDYVSAYQLSCVSYDGEEGYPGNLEVKVIYALSESDEFMVRFFARTDKPTIINLTSHPYFNLNGSGDILDHYLSIDADAYTLTGYDNLPTGEIKNVSDTPFDLREEKKLEDRFKKYDFRGYDHNFVLNKTTGEIRKIAELSEKKYGRAIELFSDSSGLQVYTGQHFTGQVTGKDDQPLYANDAIALEPQNFPDAPNHKHFPNSILKPREVYNRTIIYRFLY